VGERTLLNQYKRLLHSGKHTFCW